MYKIALKNENKIIQTENDNLMEVLEEIDSSFVFPCRGRGSCGKCKIYIKGQINSITSEEKRLLSKEEIENNIRLACKVILLGDAEISIIKNNGKFNLEKNLFKNIKFKNSWLEEKTIVIDIKKRSRSDFQRIQDNFENELQKPSIKIINKYIELLSKCRERELSLDLILYKNEILDIKESDKKNFNINYLAIDVGTTTVEIHLLNEQKGLIDSRMFVNPQIKYGMDVISRIEYSFEQDGSNKLRESILSKINREISEITIDNNLKSENIYFVFLVGNTTMNHLFFGLNSQRLGKLPFYSAINEFGVLKAYNHGISSINSEAKLLFLKNIGGFVGSDTLGAIIEKNLFNNKGNILIVDLGTNGEIVLKKEERIFVSSTAAGPAFEGINMSCGMTATDGACYNFQIDSLSNDLSYSTINEKEIKGVCGSGYISLISLLVEIGIIQSNGVFFNKGMNALSERLGEIDGKKVFYINRERNIYLSEMDIRDFQLAKAAVRTGIDVLLKENNLEIKKIDEILLTGNFGNNIDKKSVIKIGLLPFMNQEKIKTERNAAISGLVKCILDKSLYTGLKSLIDKIEHMEIQRSKYFNDLFIENISFDK